MTENTPTDQNGEQPADHPAPALNGRQRSARSRPRDEKGRLLPTDGSGIQTPSEADDIEGGRAMTSYLLTCLGGMKKTMRMYARAIRRAPEGKQLDALYDLFKLLVKQQESSDLTPEEVSMLSDEELAKLAMKFLAKPGGR